MNVEKTIEFLLKNHARADARMEAKFAKVDQRMTRLENVVRTNNRVVAGLSRYGVSLRSDVRRLEKALIRVAEAQAKSDEKLVEVEEKRNGVIDVVDRFIRQNRRTSGPKTGC